MAPVALSPTIVVGRTIVTGTRAIAARAQAQIVAAAAAGARVVFYEAALLVESGSHRWTDAVIVVAAAPATQRRRLMARDGLSAEQAEARLAAQAPLAAKLAVATWTLRNDADDDARFVGAVDAVIAEVEARFGAIVPTRAHRASTVSGPSRLLVTGFPAFTAQRFVHEVLAREPDTRIDVLAQPRFAADADAMLRALPPDDRARVTVIEGDVCDIDLGLATREYAALRRELTAIAHLASVYFTGVDDATARRINIVGTHHVLDLAADATQLRRLLHWSTARVAGRRRGDVREDELVHRAGFHNHYEATKYEAERLARAAMAGWVMASSRRRASRSANTTSPRRARSSEPSARKTSAPNARTISASAGSPGATTSRAS